MIFPPFEDRERREQAVKDARLFESLNAGTFQEVVDSIKAGACIKSVHPSGCLPVHYAAELKTSRCLDYLLQCNAKVDSKDYAGWTPLHIASGSGSMECVERLLQQSSAIDLVGNGGRESTALNIAASNGHNEVLMRLLQAGANINTPGLWGFTPLCQAAINEWPETCRLLLQNRAKVDLGNIDGRTPLHLAVISGNLVTVKVLVEYPSTLTRELKRGIVNVLCDRVKLMPKDLAFLITELAVPLSNVETRDNKGRTAIDIAVGKGWTEIVEYLRPLMSTALTVTADHAVSRVH